MYESCQGPVLSGIILLTRKEKKGTSGNPINSFKLVVSSVTLNLTQQHQIYKCTYCVLLYGTMGTNSNVIGITLDLVFLTRGVGGPTGLNRTFDWYEEELVTREK